MFCLLKDLVLSFKTIAQVFPIPEKKEVSFDVLRKNKVMITNIKETPKKILL